MATPPIRPSLDEYLEEGPVRLGAVDIDLESVRGAKQPIAAVADANRELLRLAYLDVDDVRCLGDVNGVSVPAYTNTLRFVSVGYFAPMVTVAVPSSLRRSDAEIKSPSPSATRQHQCLEMPVVVTSSDAPAAIDAIATAASGVGGGSQTETW